MHGFGINFAEKCYDKPGNYKVQMGLPEKKPAVHVHYLVSSSGDPNLPPSAWYFTIDGEMTYHVEFDPVAQTGRTYGSFHGHAQEMTDGSGTIHDLEGTFDVVYPRP